MTRAKPADTPVKFETALSELEALVEQLERGQLPLQESLAAYQRGAELLKQCHAQLDAADARLQVLEGDLLKPFEPDQESGQ